mmetsp:Transcript_44475/g.43143  ORF Transcript_44475/g.43143 Transcript_44475/m.43143 type:complete len:89 (+) Transcript_44475:159-425(+)
MIENMLRGKQEVVFDPPFDDWLFLTIRGILDSKYFELIFNETLPTCFKASRFVDFVYAWLGNFTVDKMSKMVRTLEFYEKDRSDSYRV